MQIIVDIGNSDAVFGLYSQATWQHIWRTPSRTDEPAGSYESRLRLWLLEAGISLSAIQTTVLSSVVPNLTPTMRSMLTTLFGFEPVVMGPGVYPILPLEILRPHEIGTDLVANALAAYTRYQRNCVVVDFGTALTFTTVSGAGKILGVAIAPGLKTAIRSLFANTAQLPEVPIEVPASALGTSTTHAIQAGVVLGYEGLVRSLLDRIRTELNGDCIAIATGGLSGSIPSLHAAFTAVIPSLTLDGIRIVGEIIGHDTR
ncbi:putative transcriptional acitvator, Baf family [Fibrisoma limi BUZ 3]|uniref:Type III pantothenate kinase n=1 Tax=Fibrisoma limi BUZ 3 TaxID=1185876 RepID=I2GTF8_9BACT|nr:type III pantothenate kinase [Fibrisoma limi]CCH57187.1 putative transcriptional acitvator, Baf family [Fibrisoma limi BUZ 3]